MVTTSTDEQGKPMGFVHVDITLTNLFAKKSINVRALVDTGAFMMGVLDLARSQVNVGFLPGTRFHHLPNSLPRASRQILSERLLYQRHENRALGVGDVGAENFRAFET